MWLGFYLTTFFLIENKRITQYNDCDYFTALARTSAGGQFF